MKRACPARSLPFVWFLVGAMLLLSGAVSCTSSPVDRPWVYADLRLISAQDAPTPATDILAVYTRATYLSVDLRVDLLDINPGDQYSLRLSLWDNRNFSQQPLRIDISSSGAVEVSGRKDGKPYLWPRVIQDFGLDTITVNLNRFLLGDRYHLDVATYTTDPLLLADEVRDVRSDGQPPVRRAPLLLAFWDTFPAATPAQAMRRWDGAHTGPLGDRHGLVHVLNGVRQYKVPVALLDIKNPASLAALDFMGNIPVLQELYARGLLILPDVAYGEPSRIALDFSRRAAAGFGLPVSQFVSSPASDPTLPPAPISGYLARFLPLQDASHLVGSGGMRYIPLPSGNTVEATEDGPSLDVRRALMRAATSPDPASLVILGGSLPNSTWGDSNIVYPTFAWIAAHPWIQPLAAPDLLTFPAKEQRVVFAPAEGASSWLKELNSAPDNAITRSAWQVYLALTAPTVDKQLQSLRSAYLGQVGELLAAARWAETPAPQVDCTKDLNLDGQAECILANQKFFGILETAGARLTQFFYLDLKGPHQVIGPSSQFTVGLSDPSEWQLQNGEAADPSVIAGAFMDKTGTWAEYRSSVTTEGITFTAADGSLVKTYRLLENGIQVEYRTRAPANTSIPIALDSQAFYFRPTNYQAGFAPHVWTWSMQGGSSVELHSSATISANGFTSSLPFLSMPEDPNLAYPAGDYLPFPLSVASIRSDGSFMAEIIVK